MVNVRHDAGLPTAITLIRPLPNGRTQKIEIGITITETGSVYSTDVASGPR